MHSYAQTDGVLLTKMTEELLELERLTEGRFLALGANGGGHRLDRQAVPAGAAAGRGRESPEIILAPLRGMTSFPDQGCPRDDMELFAPDPGGSVLRVFTPNDRKGS